MSRRAGSIYLGLLIVAISSSFSGCSSNSNNIISNGNTSIPVTVTDFSGNKVQGVTVVLGDSNGAMKSYGLTDANGSITFSDAPADATITAATSCLYSGATITTYSINVRYDVNAPVTLVLDVCSAVSYSIPPPPQTLGTITVNVTNIPIEVTHNSLTVGRQGFASLNGLITNQTVTMTENDLDPDGTFSIFVNGLDGNNVSIAYGILSNQTFTDGMIVDVNMKPMSYAQYQIINIPATPIALLPAITTYGRPSAPAKWPSPYPLTSVPSSTTLNVPYMPGLGNGYTHHLEVVFDQDHDGIDDSQQSFSVNELSVSIASNQIFDLSKALSAPYVTVSNANSSTPTFSWTGVDSAATGISAWINMHQSPEVFLFIGLNGLTRTRTSITYPELPASLAVFRPAKTDYFTISTSAFDGIVFRTSSGYYRGTNP